MFATSDAGARNRKLVLISAKSSREIDLRKRKRSKVLPLEVMISMAHRSHSLRGPNMSEKIGGSKLYAFPLFDKCDSLLFFPSTFAALLNSADLPSLTKLLKLRTDKNCAFHTCGQAMDLDKYMNVFEIVNELHPDSVTCVHQTKVIENKICSSVYMKLTDSQSLYRLMSYVSLEPDVSSMCIPDRAQRFKLYAKDFGTTDLIKQQLIACAVTNDDVLFYIRMDLTLTFDDTTKKIIGMDHTYELTSLHIINNPVQIDY